VFLSTASHRALLVRTNRFFEPYNPGDRNADGCHGAYEIDLCKDSHDKGTERYDGYQGCKKHA
jgi:hypothetical protein